MPAKKNNNNKKKDEIKLQPVCRVTLQLLTSLAILEGRENSVVPLVRHFYTIFLYSWQKNHSLQQDSSRTIEA